MKESRGAGANSGWGGALEPICLQRGPPLLTNFGAPGSTFGEQVDLDGPEPVWPRPPPRRLPHQQLSWKHLFSSNSEPCGARCVGQDVEPLPCSGLGADDPARRPAERTPQTPSTSGGNSVATCSTPGSADFGPTPVDVSGSVEQAPPGRNANRLPTTTLGHRWGPPTPAHRGETHLFGVVYHLRRGSSPPRVVVICRKRLPHCHGGAHRAGGRRRERARRSSLAERGTGHPPRQRRCDFRPRTHGKLR